MRNSENYFYSLGIARELGRLLCTELIAVSKKHLELWRKNLFEWTTLKTLRVTPWRRVLLDKLIV
jgi:hypothetical protein